MKNNIYKLASSTATKWKVSWLMICLFMIGMFSQSANAQTITSLLLNNNGSSVVVFTFTNANAFGVNITTIGTHCGFTGTQTATFWTKPSVINPGAVGAISVANGWTVQATQSVATVSNTTTTATGTTAATVLSGMNVFIPAGGIYRFAIQMSSSIRYSTLGTQVGTYTNGGCTINMTANNGYGGTLASPTNTPRGFGGFISFVPALPCVGQPTAGNTVAAATAVCPSVPVALSLQNSQGTGTDYQWESSPDGSSWSPIPLATSGNYSSLIAADTYFRCLVTCTNSGLSDYSLPILITVNPFFNCYCSAIPGITADEEIYGVTVDGINNSLACGVTAPGPGSIAYRYSNFDVDNTTPTWTLFKGVTVPAQVQENECDGVTYYAFGTGVWIDYNHNGSFTDPGEEVFKEATTLIGPRNINFNITPPLTAVTGLTRMRIIVAESTSGAALIPCLTYNYGETEDYLINILPVLPCVDPPTAGAATSNYATFCETASPAINLNLSGNSIGAGQTYQWQYSYDDLSYIDIGAAQITAPYVANPTTSTYYRCMVTCGATSIESASVLVSAVPAPASGVATGPATLTVGGAAGVFDVTGQSANFVWQSATVLAGPYTTIPGSANITPINLSAPSAGTFYVRALSVEYGCADSPSNVLTVVATIANDNVCGALPVNIGNNGPYTNAGATAQAGEPAPPATGCNTQTGWCNSTLTYTVWYTFTVPVGGSGRYQFQAPAWDSQIAVYSAADCNAVTSGGATLLQANDDALASLGAGAIVHCLVAGQTYFIQVDAYSTTIPNTNFFVNIIDDGFANPSFTGLPVNACVVTTSIALTPAVAGGTFSGTGVSGNSFSPSSAGAGTWPVTYTLGGIDNCYYSTQSITVDPVIATYYADADGDTYGNPSAPIQSCSALPIAGEVVDATDCNDGSAAVNPAAVEVCNLIDDNCNGTVDEGFDVDGDTYYTCTGDCNDNDPLINPAALEVCNGIDDNCNGLNDDGLLFTTYYADADGDTYGDPSVSVSTCDGAPLGYVLDNTDCNDLVATANPAGTELCNGIDDDCDGLTDEFTEPNAGAISGPASQCVPVVTGSATFSIAPVPYATSYNWVVPAGISIISGQGTNSIFVFWTPLAATNGIIGTLSVTASNACGSGAPSSVAIDINYTAPVTPPSISGASRICQSESSLYSIAPVARASSYTWSVPVGMTITSGQGSNIINVSVDGSYIGGVMTVTANNACGSSPVRIKNVLLNTPGAPAAISGPASGVCSNLGVVYSTAGSPVASSYIWSVPSGATIVSGQGTSSITVDFSNSYSGGPITVAGINNCGVGAVRSLSVAGAPGLPGVISGPIAICPNQAGVVYQISTVTGADTYTWTVPGGAVITSGQGTKIITVTYGPNPSTGQIVTVKASNSCGTSTARVLSNITIAFINCVRIGSSSSNTTLDVYPNPATDRINVNFTAAVATNYTLKMTDLAGRVVYAEQGAAIEGNNMKEINLDQLAGGIYMVILESNGGTQQVRLVVE